jgi:hypothetical protein
MKLTIPLLAAALASSAAAAAPFSPGDTEAFGAVMGALQGGWRSDCKAGGSAAKAEVAFSLDGAGQLTGEPTATSELRGPAAEAAKSRAIAAVKSAAPFKTLPPAFYGKNYNVVFDGHAACASGG